MPSGVFMCFARFRALCAARARFCSYGHGSRPTCCKTARRVHGGRPLCQFHLRPRGGLGRIYDDLTFLPAHGNPPMLKHMRRKAVPIMAQACGRKAAMSGSGPPAVCVKDIVVALVRIHV